MQNSIPKDLSLGFPKRIVRANVIGLIFLFIIQLLIAGVFYAFTISESLIPIFAYLVAYLASFVVGVVSSREASEKGYKNGLIAGIVFCGVMFIISSFLNDRSIIEHLIKIVICLVISTIGGIVGINIKTKKNRR